MKTMESPTVILDPSSLTTAQLQREISSLDHKLTQRIDGIDKAIELAHDDLVRFPTAIDKAVGTLKELHNEKFLGVGQRFIDNKMALDAAFKSQQDAVSKNELSTIKQLDALQMQINDLKERALRNEGKDTGKNASWALLVAIIAVLAALFGIASRFWS